MIFEKTALGRSALSDKSIAMTMQQRTALIMLDGKRSQHEVLTSTSAVGVSTEDINHLVSAGFVIDVSATIPAPLSALPIGASNRFAAIPDPEAQARFSKAYLIATRLTSALGLRGFRLNLAVERAGSLQDLLALASKIENAVGPENFKELYDALH